MLLFFSLFIFIALISPSVAAAAVAAATRPAAAAASPAAAGVVDSEGLEEGQVSTSYSIC